MKARIRRLPRRIKKKPRKPKSPEYRSEEQKQAHELLRRFEAASDHSELIVPFMTFLGSIHDHAIPEVIAARAMSRMKCEVRRFLNPDGFTARAWYQEGKYPNATPQITVYGNAESFWVAVALCYLKLCLSTARKL
jgi:hypothetical protein